MQKINELRLRFLCRYMEENTPFFRNIRLVDSDSCLSDQAIDFLYGKKTEKIKDETTRLALTREVLECVLTNNLLPSSRKSLSDPAVLFDGQKVISAINIFFNAKSKCILPRTITDNFKQESLNRANIRTKQRGDY